MTVSLLTEAQVPEVVMKLLATPVARADQTWYVAARSSAGQWLVATLWNEQPRPPHPVPTWGVSFRGEAVPSLFAALVEHLTSSARQFGCSVLVTDAMKEGAPYDALLQATGFRPDRRYLHAETTTIDAVRGLGIGVSGESLGASGWAIRTPDERDLPVIAEAFASQLGQIPPQVAGLLEAPETYQPIDTSWLLMRKGKLVAALMAKRINQTIDAQGLVCHPRWRTHRAFAWFMATTMHKWIRLGSTIRFSYPEDNKGMSDIAHRIGARPLWRLHDLKLHVPD